jgi:hypothetical protein
LINSWASIYGAMILGDDDEHWKQHLYLVDMSDEHAVYRERAGLDFYGITVDPNPIDRSFELGLSIGHLVSSADMVRFRMQCRGDMLESIREIFIRHINGGSLANDEPWRPRVKDGTVTAVLSDARVMINEDSPFLPRLTEASKRLRDRNFFYSIIDGRAAPQMKS